MMKIDFVITWVDSEDENWLLKKREYYEKEKDTYFIRDGISRFRDWGTFKYLFRGIDAFAPWVRRVFLITNGNSPKWLNIHHPKIAVVNQNEFIPSKYLPTFNIHTIEHCLYRINGLSEHFVYFNDDMFILRNLSPSDFFVKGLPVDTGILTVHCYSKKVSSHFCKEADTGVINDHFEFKSTLYHNFFKWFNIKYGTGLLKNIILFNCPRFPGIEQHHLPTPLLKKTFYEVWDAEKDQLDITCSHKLRHATDLNQWVYRNWQLANGSFIPRSRLLGTNFSVGYDKKDTIEQYVKQRKRKIVCVNDVLTDDFDKNDSFEKWKEWLIGCLDEVLPNKCSFEI